VFARAQERAAVAAIGKSRNVSFHGLFLVADLETRLQRVAARKRDASDADVAVVRQQEMFMIDPVEWPKIDASGSPAETLARARAGLEGDVRRAGAR
jgi:hypothetical protein